ncbi:putative odorant-binding protein A5 [Lucilia cuprina]|uniref:Putative odorant-binding protein A5 n=1 Tax=Lucilia cuprina TaxID=7375 RepID=A0A0L0CS48_LUCCU|nr:putative odorant-binding protein A5 [Lucilia cuprina]
MFLQIFLSILLLTQAIADDIDVETLFKETKVIPDVLQTAPKEKLKLEFENGLIVGDGKEFTPTETKDAPTLDWSSDPNTYYTVYMASPDAPYPDNPIWKEFIHWLVVNIPGKDVDKGEIYCPYLGPISPKTGSIMRYVFLVYEQPGKLQFDEPYVNHSKLEGHSYFKVEKFAEKYNLGKPLAGNIFRSQWDEYVPILHKRMGVTVDD